MDNLGENKLAAHESLQVILLETPIEWVNFSITRAIKKRMPMKDRKYKQ